MDRVQGVGAVGRVVRTLARSADRGGDEGDSLAAIKEAARHVSGTCRKQLCKRLIIKDLLVEARGVEPLSENAESEETTCLFDSCRGH